MGTLFQSIKTMIARRRGSRVDVVRDAAFTRTKVPGTWTLLLGVGLVLLAGCSRTPETDVPSASVGDEESRAASELVSRAKDLSTEELIQEALGSDFDLTILNIDEDGKEPTEPFTPPSLEEIEKSANWKKMPVRDAAADLLALQKENPPIATVAEALALRNNSPEDNDKILSALGRLPTSDSKVVWDATINRHLAAEVKSTNPLLISSTAEFDVSGLIGGGLFGFDWEMIPFAASETVVSWESSEDHRMDKVVLRQDWTWSDGTPVTAHDIEFSYHTIMDREIPVTAVRSGTDELLTVKAYDDRTVVFFHKQPLVTNVWNINFPIIPKHIYEKTIPEDKTLQNSSRHLELEANPVVCGAYTIRSRVQGQEIILERRDSYYMHQGKQVREKPYFKTVRFRVIENNNTQFLALLAGEIDEGVLTPEQWTNQSNDDDFYRRNTKVKIPEWTYFYFGWNNESIYFSDPRVRKAMSYAFDYDEFMKITHQLFDRASTLFHPDSWMAPQPPLPIYVQDLDRAEELLDEAGWVDSDGDGIRDKVIDGKLVPFDFTLLVSNSPERIRYANLMKESLDLIGVRCNVKPIEFTVLTQRMVDHDFDASFGGWGTGTDPDTAENVWSSKEKLGGRNFLNYSNAEVDRLFKAGKHVHNKDVRAEIYRRIATLIYEDQPCTFLYTRASFHGFNKKLRGYWPSPRGFFHYSPGFGGIWQAKP